MRCVGRGFIDILIRRTITSEPARVPAAVDGVPLSDSLRFEPEASGPSNTPEFGSVKITEGAESLYAMGAYYHAKNASTNPPYLLAEARRCQRETPKRRTTKQPYSEEMLVPGPQALTEGGEMH